VKGFLSTLEILTIDDSSAERSGEVLTKLEREGRTIDPRDLFIGCVAVENGYRSPDRQPRAPRKDS